ncbi:MAG: FliO/MopB family protein, partial [Actinomycetota bacterium]
MLSVDIVGRLLGSLFLIVGALGLIAYLGKRSHRTARSLMRVHTRMSIAKGVSVAIVEVGERFLLVGIGEKGVNLLAELDPSELPAPEETKEERTTPRFLEALTSSASQRLSGNSSSLQSGRGRLAPWKPLGKSLRPAASSSVGGLDAASLQQFMSQSLTDGPRTGFVTRLRQRTLRTRLRGPSDAAQS